MTLGRFPRFHPRGKWFNPGGSGSIPRGSGSIAGEVEDVDVTRIEISLGADRPSSYQAWAHPNENWRIFAPNMRTRVEFIAFL